MNTVLEQDTYRYFNILMHYKNNYDNSKKEYYVRY